MDNLTHFISTCTLSVKSPVYTAFTGNDNIDISMMESDGYQQRGRVYMDNEELTRITPNKPFTSFLKAEYNNNFYELITVSQSRE